MIYLNRLKKIELIELKNYKSIEFTGLNVDFIELNNESSSELLKSLEY